MKTHMLQYRAAAATAALEAAQTPMAKRLAHQEGIAVKADLEKFVADGNAITAIKAAHTQPQNSFGMFKSAPVHDRPVFMTGPAGTKITKPIVLPDGTKAAANPSGQISVPIKLLPAMLARGFLRANDTAVTTL